MPEIQTESAAKLCSGMTEKIENVTFLEIMSLGRYNKTIVITIVFFVWHRLQQRASGRDLKAREAFRQMRRSRDRGIYLIDLLREGWKNNDERLQRIVLG